MTKKKYRRYSPEFKRHVLKRASEDGMTDALVVDRIVRADREVLLKSMLQVKMRSDPISGESESELF